MTHETLAEELGWNGSADEVNEPRTWGIDAPEPSDVRYVRDRYGCLFEKFADNVWHRWRAGVGRFGEADWTWSELASDLPVEVLGTPLELTPPAPAEPAEEETKAEVGGDFIEIVFTGAPAAVSGRFVEVENPQGASISVGEWIDRGDGFWALRIPYASRPVVPAPTEASVIGGAAVALRSAMAALDPHEGGDWEHAWRTVEDLEDCAERADAPASTETGPWHDIEQAPKHLTLIDRDGDKWMYDGDNWVTPETAILPVLYINRKYAPFVAAEEG